MLWSVDTCQNKVFANQHHVTLLQAQVLELTKIMFLKLTADQVLVFVWTAGQCQVNL